jgi:PIN domain nuclease of toxin-antitoxin system
VRLLLDSHAFLWAASSPAQLASAARAAIENVDNDVFVSVASAWELAIKAGLGRLRMPAALEATIDRRGFQRLGISFAHAAAAGALPRLHGDPFDRMLIAQAQSEGLTWVTRDRAFSVYGLAILQA